MADVPILHMDKRPRGSAAGDMRRQFEESGGYMYNASRMWREVGSPKGKGPEVWLDLAAPLVTGIQGYFANLEGVPEDHDFNDEWVLCLTEASDPEMDMRACDQLMTFLLAMAYARYLDAEPELD